MDNNEPFLAYNLLVIPATSFASRIVVEYSSSFQIYKDPSERLISIMHAAQLTHVRRESRDATHIKIGMISHLCTHIMMLYLHIID